VFAADNRKDKTLDATLSDAAVVVSASHGDAALYDKLLAVSRSSGDPEAREDALRTLARFRDPELVQRTLEYLVSGEVRNQDSWVVLVALLRDGRTREQAWDFMRANWDKVRAQLTVSSGEDVVGATGFFCSVERRDEVTNFFAAHKVEASERTLAKAVDRINACVQLRATQEGDFHRWLAVQVK
jgi:aminopeptidase N/puromycin-sensitive aminopeptidase